MIQLKKLYLYISNAITLYDVEETKKKAKRKEEGIISIKLMYYITSITLISI